MACGWMRLRLILGILVLVTIGGVLATMYVDELAKLKGAEGSAFINVQHSGKTVLKLPVGEDIGRTVDLYPYTGRHITLGIEREGVRVLSSDCRDKVCVNAGYVTELSPVACLPNEIALYMDYN